MDLNRGASSSALRAEVASQRVTYDQITKQTPLSTSTVVGYLTGGRSVPTLDFIQIIDAI